MRCFFRFSNARAAHIIKRQACAPRNSSEKSRNPPENPSFFQNADFERPRAHTACFPPMIDLRRCSDALDSIPRCRCGADPSGYLLTLNMILEELALEGKNPLTAKERRASQEPLCGQALIDFRKSSLRTSVTRMPASETSLTAPIDLTSDSEIGVLPTPPPSSPLSSTAIDEDPVRFSGLPGREALELESCPADVKPLGEQENRREKTKPQSKQRKTAQPRQRHYFKQSKRREKELRELQEFYYELLLREHRLESDSEPISLEILMEKMEDSDNRRQHTRRLLEPSPERDAQLRNVTKLMPQMPRHPELSGGLRQLQLVFPKDPHRRLPTQKYDQAQAPIQQSGSIKNSVKSLQISPNQEQFWQRSGLVSSCPTPDSIDQAPIPSFPALDDRDFGRLSGDGVQEVSNKNLSKSTQKSLIVSQEELSRTSELANSSATFSSIDEALTPGFDAPNSHDVAPGSHSPGSREESNENQLKTSQKLSGQRHPSASLQHSDVPMSISVCASAASKTDGVAPQNPSTRIQPYLHVFRNEVTPFGIGAENEFVKNSVERTQKSHSLGRQRRRLDFASPVPTPDPTKPTPGSTALAAIDVDELDDLKASFTVTSSDDGFREVANTNTLEYPPQTSTLNYLERSTSFKRRHQTPYLEHSYSASGSVASRAEDFDDSNNFPSFVASFFDPESVLVEPRIDDILPGNEVSSQTLTVEALESRQLALATTKPQEDDFTRTHSQQRLPQNEPREQEGERRSAVQPTPTGVDDEALKDVEMLIREFSREQTHFPKSHPEYTRMLCDLVYRVAQRQKQSQPLKRQVRGRLEPGPSKRPRHSATNDTTAAPPVPEAIDGQESRRQLSKPPTQTAVLDLSIKQRLSDRQTAPRRLHWLNLTARQNVVQRTCLSQHSSRSPQLQRVPPPAQRGHAAPAAVASEYQTRTRSGRIVLPAHHEDRRAPPLIDVAASLMPSSVPGQQPTQPALSREQTQPQYGPRKQSYLSFPEVGPVQSYPSLYRLMQQRIQNIPSVPDPLSTPPGLQTEDCRSMQQMEAHQCYALFCQVMQQRTLNITSVPLSAQSELWTKDYRSIPRVAAQQRYPLLYALWQPWTQSIPSVPDPFNVQGQQEYERKVLQSKK